MDCMWIWIFKWIQQGYRYGYDMDVDTDLDMVMRCSKKLYYILAWEQMMPYSTFKMMQGMTRHGGDMLYSGFSGFWVFMCMYDNKYKN